MITNARLVSYTPPDMTDANGGRTPAAVVAFPAGRLCAVGEPTRAMLLTAANKVSGISGVLYVGVDALAGMPVPQVGGRITYVLDRTGEEWVVELLAVTAHMHAGLSHYQLGVKHP